MKSISLVMRTECKKIWPGYKIAQIRMALACWIGGQPLADAIVLTEIRTKIMGHVEGTAFQLLHKSVKN